MFTRNWKKENSICERLGLPTKVWIHNAIELKLATYLEYILRIRVFHFHHLIGSYRLEWWKIFDFSLGMQWEVAWYYLTPFQKKIWKLIEKGRSGCSGAGCSSRPWLVDLPFFNKFSILIQKWLPRIACQEENHCNMFFGKLGQGHFYLTLLETYQFDYTSFYNYIIA